MSSAWTGFTYCVAVLLLIKVDFQLMEIFNLPGFFRFFAHLVFFTKGFRMIELHIKWRMSRMIALTFKDFTYCCNLL